MCHIGCRSGSFRVHAAETESGHSSRRIWGRGHHDYSGNEIYASDLNSLVLSRLTDPGIPVVSDPACPESLAAGNRTTSTAVSVIVDRTPPTVSITSPPNGSSITGTMTGAATASDNLGVVGVQFQLDGANWGAEITASPYSVPWNTATANEGSHALTAIARDAAGNRTTFITVSVIVDRTAPSVSITIPSNGSSVRGTITVSATASDNVGVAGVQFPLDGVPGLPSDRSPVQGGIFQYPEPHQFQLPDPGRLQ
jgi:hypothetical protein